MTKEEKTTKSRDILVVEDNKIVQNMLQKTLLLTEYKAHVARNGRDAVKMVKEKKGKFTAILLDLFMPIMDGAKAIAEIRSLPNEKAQTIIIAVTGNHDDYTEEQFQQMGFNAAIIKPVTFNEVLTTLERATDPKADKWLGITNKHVPRKK
ncbi:MAG: response regulator [Bacteroidota bacterium]